MKDGGCAAVPGPARRRRGEVVEQPSIFRTGPLSTGRVEAFSDGVLAVVSTLLVLDVKLPGHLPDDAAIWNALIDLVPALAAWAISFGFVLTFWVSHHYFFASLRHTDRGLLWLNGLFLLTIALVPFPTGLVGEYPGLTAPLALLSGAMLLCSLSFALMRLYVSFHGRLLRSHFEGRQARAAMAQSAVAPLIYAIAIVLAFVWPPGAVAAQVVVLALFFVRTPSRHPDAREQEE
jgi:uncharacterized membrane protein